MVKAIIDSQLNNTLCEAAGCFAEATTKIHVKVGDLRTMPLLLCEDCTTKFEDSDNVRHLDRRCESQKAGQDRNIKKQQSESRRQPGTYSAASIRSSTYKPSGGFAD